MLPKKLPSLAIAALATFLMHCSIASDMTVSPTSDEPAKTEPGASEKTTKSANAPGSNASDGEGKAVGPGEDGASVEAFPPTDPGEWTWLGPEEFDNAPECMDGTLTGLGLSRSPTGSKKVLIFMQGGGACFDGQTCAIADHALSADHMDADTFAEWKDSAGRATVMNRDRSENPFRDWNYVFVPYCSGDVFSGANEKGFDGRPQLGFKNVSAYLPRLKATFHDAQQVVLGGTSAGGYGAAYNYVQVQKAFAGLDITVIDDSGPPLSSTFTPTCLQEKWASTWQMDKTSPVDGPFPLREGGGGLFQLVQDLIRAHPKSKFAFISHEADLVMRYFHGIGFSFNCAAPGLLSGDFFADGLREVRSIQGDNFLTYYGPGRGHQYFKGDDADLYDTEAGGVNLATWLGQIVNGEDAPKRVPAEF